MTSCLLALTVHRNNPVNIFSRQGDAENYAVTEDFDYRLKSVHPRPSEYGR